MLHSLLEQRLPVLGHRNWIVIADMAYPQQSNPGIETVYIGGDHLDAVHEMLTLLDKAPHLRPTIFVDHELELVSEKNAPGISAFRDELHCELGEHTVQQLPHEDIIRKLDEAAKIFSILILKTDFILPYTSVFLRMECGYWTQESERELQKAMHAHKENLVLT